MREAVMGEVVMREFLTRVVAKDQILSIFDVEK